jgi:hypothetical protein
MGKFSDDYRASVILMLETEGYPENPYALGSVHNYLKQKAPYPDKSTLSKWFKGTITPPPQKIINEKKGDMVDAFKDLAWKLIAHAGSEDTIAEMSGQQAITSIGILVDKIQLLEGKATAINENRNAHIIIKTGMSLDDL